MDMKSLTGYAQNKGITVGWDLAHGEKYRHQIARLECRFWCHYKYINSGPGATAGYFVHERHHGKADIPRFEGWWGHDKKLDSKCPKP